MAKRKKESLMMRVSEFVVSKRILILIVFSALLVFSLVSLSWVEIEDDIISYLGKHTESHQSIAIDAQEFTTYADANMVLRGLTLEDVDQVHNVVETLDNVFNYTEDVREEEGGYTAVYYFSMNSLPEDAESYSTLSALQLLADQFDEGYVYAGFADNMGESVTEQMGLVIVVVAITILIVLLLTSQSYAEIPVLLLVFLFAAGINMGTHFLLGKISMISNAVAVTLQLALSIDYAIIFCNRYREAHETLPIREAVVKALSGAAPEILASSLTTIAGLIAMCFMEFELGLDMGLVLIKSIAISLLSVFLVMPALLMAFGKAIDRTRHKRWLPNIPFVGKFAYATRVIFPVLFLGVLVGAYFLFGGTNYIYDCKQAPSKYISEASQAYNEMVAEGVMNYVEILVPAGDYETEKALLDRVEALPQITKVAGITKTDAIEGYMLADMIGYKDIEKLAGVDDTTAMASLALYATENDEYDVVLQDLSGYQAPLIDVFLCIHDHINDPEMTLNDSQREMLEEVYLNLRWVKNEFQGPHYSRLVAYLNLPMEGEETFAFIDELKALVASYYPSSTHLAGNSIVYYEFQQSFQNDKVITSVLSIALVILILFFTFKSFGMPVMLILVIQGSIWINFAISAIKGGTVFFVVYLLVSSIQMGSNIDYAIVISSRYLELRKESNDKRQIIIDTMNFAFPTVITSGGIMVVAGYMIYNIVTEGIVSSFGGFIGSGTVVTIALVMFVLPQLLLATDKVILATSFKMPQIDLKRGGSVLRRACAAVLALACVGTWVTVAAGQKKLTAERDVTIAACEADLDTLNSLTAQAKAYEYAAGNTDSMSIVEKMMTDVVGEEQLEEGKQQLEEGKQQLEEGKSQYEEGLAEYEDYLEQLENGQAQLDTGKAQYQQGMAAYQAGLKEYQAGKKLYEENLALYNQGVQAFNEAKAYLAENQAVYDAAKAQYDAGVQQYNSAKAQLDAISAVYNLVNPLYQRYLSLQQQYDAAVAEGSSSAASLYLLLTAAKALYETQLGSTGYSISSLLSGYESGQVQLAEAQVQLADAKVQLDDGAAQLADGYAQLNAAEAQLNSAKVQLADAKKQLDDADAQLKAAKQQLAGAAVQLDEGQAQLDEGKAQLDDGKAQLDEGKALLEENTQKLADGEKELQEARDYLDENQAALEEDLAGLAAQKKQGDTMLVRLNGLNCITDVRMNEEARATGYQLCQAAETYCAERIEKAENQQRMSMIAWWILRLAAVLGIATAIFWFARFGNRRTMTVLGTIGVLALLGIVLCMVSGLTAQMATLAAAVLMAIAVGSMVLMQQYMKKMYKDEEEEEFEMDAAAAASAERPVSADDIAAEIAAALGSSDNR